MALLRPPILDHFKTGLKRSEVSLLTIDGYSNSFQLSFYLNNEKTNDWCFVKIINPDTGELLTEDFLLLQMIQKGNKYYIDINEVFLNSVDKFQVQVRLINSQINPILSGGIRTYEQWVNKNLSSLSGWSQSVIFNIVEEPVLLLNDFVNKKLIIEEANHLTLSGTFYCENDQLKWWKIKNSSFDSEIIIPKAINTLFYDIDYSFKAGADTETNANYSLTIAYMTEKGYYEEVTDLSIEVGKKLKEIDSSFDVDKMSIEAKPINNLGLIQVSLDLGSYNLSIEHIGYITLYRSDYSSNFTKLEILKVLPYRFISDKNNKIVFQDFLAVSGIPYKYFFDFSYIDTDSQIEYFSPQKATTDSAILLIEDIYLNTKDVQVQLIYNAKINSIKHNIQTSITPTLGAKYPRVRRNGQQNYRTFQISGTIALDGNNNTVGFNASKIKENLQNLDSYSINSIMQRFLREEVFSFLLNDSVKLMRTLQEGNVLVQLSDINITPNATLSRNICDFTASATEIADATLESYHKYILQDNIDKVYNQNYFALGTFVAQDTLQTQEDQVSQYQDNDYALDTYYGYLFTKEILEGNSKSNEIEILTEKSPSLFAHINDQDSTDTSILENDSNTPGLIIPPIESEGESE